MMNDELQTAVTGEAKTIDSSNGKMKPGDGEGRIFKKNQILSTFFYVDQIVFLSSSKSLKIPYFEKIVCTAGKS